MPAPWLNANDVFPGGEIVDIVQRSHTGETGHHLPCARLEQS